MRGLWIVGGALLAGAALFFLAVAAAPGLFGGGSSSSSGGAGFASWCRHHVYSGAELEMPPADMERTFAYRAGEVHALTFPAGPYYAIFQYSGDDVVFLRARPPMVDEGRCAEAPFEAHVRALGEGEARLRVWLPAS